MSKKIRNEIKRKRRLKKALKKFNKNRRYYPYQVYFDATSNWNSYNGTSSQSYNPTVGANIYTTGTSSYNGYSISGNTIIISDDGTLPIAGE